MSRAEVFKLCAAAPKGIARVCKGRRVKEPKTKINVIQVYINIYIIYNYSNDNNNETHIRLKFYM